MNAMTKVLMAVSLVVAMLPTAQAASKANVLIEVCKSAAVEKLGVEQRYVRLKQINNAGRTTRVWLRVAAPETEKYTALCKVSRKSKEVKSLVKL